MGDGALAPLLDGCVALGRVGPGYGQHEPRTVAGALAQLDPHVVAGTALGCHVEGQDPRLVDLGHGADHQLRGHVGREPLAHCRRLALLAGDLVGAEPEVPRHLRRAGQLALVADGPAAAVLGELGLVQAERVHQGLVPGDARVGRRGRLAGEDVAQVAEAQLPAGGEAGAP